MQWLVDNNITTIVDLREEKEYKVSEHQCYVFLRSRTEYVKEHPEVDINIIIPNAENIKKVLERL